MEAATISERLRRSNFNMSSSWPKKKSKEIRGSEGYFLLCFPLWTSASSRYKLAIYSHAVVITEAIGALIRQQSNSATTPWWNCIRGWYACWDWFCFASTPTWSSSIWIPLVVLSICCMTKKRDERCILRWKSLPSGYSASSCLQELSQRICCELAQGCCITFLARILTFLMLLWIKNGHSPSSIMSS